MEEVKELTEQFQPELVIIESGGDNLAANFSRELADFIIYVVDVAGKTNSLFRWSRTHDIDGRHLIKWSMHSSKKEPFRKFGRLLAQDPFQNYP